MENASKALIIAGAILLAILLISLGILVYTQASSTINDTKIDTEAAQAFNQKITQYCGSSKNASEANALVEAIAASNGAQSKLANKHYISIKFTGQNFTERVASGGEITDPKNGGSYPVFKDSYKYTIKYSTGNDGYVNNVEIS